MDDTTEIKETRSGRGAKTCPFRPQECGAQCALFNAGYHACCLKLLAASLMKMAEFRKDSSSY